MASGSALLLHRRTECDGYRSTTFLQPAFLVAVVVKFLKLLLALLLMPLLAGELWTLIDLARHAMPAGQWSQAWFLSFGVGFITWLVVFFVMPRTMWLYVLGHEFTHALATMLAGGKVSSFQVSAKGGHVITDRVNWWITLAPYFVPLYAILWMGLWLTIDFYHPLRQWQPILYFGLGLLWCFHLTFTTSMMHLKQSDLSSQGFVFSFVVIGLINLAMFLLLFMLLAHDLTMSAAGHIFLQRVGDCYVITGEKMAEGWTWAWNAVSGHV